MELPSFCTTILRIFFSRPLIQRARHGVSAALTPLRLTPTRSRALFCLVALWSADSLATANADYSPLQLKQDVAKFLATHYSKTPHERLDIKVGNLDNRLRLAACPGALSFNLQDPTDLGGNISVQARCGLPNGWSLHVPAQVVIYRSIPVAARTVTRGEVLNESHLIQHVVDVSSIRQGYALTHDQIVGREAKRNIAQGEAFRSSALDAPTTIKRGEIVTLQAQSGGIKVVSSGVALADGRLGQKIRVRNSSSERIVTGVVLNQGIVQTL